MPESEKPKRRWARFSLATLLFVSLCIGGLLGGYQAGYRSGYHSGQTTLHNETPVTEAYNTALLIWPDVSPAEKATDTKEIIDLIKSTIATEIWGDGSGNDIVDFPENQSLVICAPGSVQHQIHDLFDQLEGLQNRESIDDLIPALQALASEGKTQASVLEMKAPKDSAAAGVWLDKYFAAVVKGVSKQWGAPRYEGECTKAGFPEWSLDQRIATWPRGNGLSYVALRATDDGQVHVVAGWHEKS